MQSFAVNGKLPRCVLIVHIESIYFHCSKAIVRSKLWDEATKIDRKQPAVDRHHRGGAEPGQTRRRSIRSRGMPERIKAQLVLNGCSPFHPHAVSASRMCAGTGAVTATGGLFLEIGTTISRECRCSGGPPTRGARP